MLSWISGFFPFRKKEKFVIERRKDERVRVTDGVRLDFTRGFRKKNQSYGTGRNISISGIRFATPFFLRKGDKLDMTLNLHKKYHPSKQIQVKAKVMNFSRPSGANRYRAGCRFIQLDESTRAELKSFMAWLDERRLGQKVSPEQ